MAAPKGSDVALDLATMPPRERAAWMSGYEWGWTHARASGDHTYEQMIEDIAACYVRMIHLNEEIERGVDVLLKSPPYATLADRRGQHDRAEAQRRTLRQRGVA